MSLASFSSLGSALQARRVLSRIRFQNLVSRKMFVSGLSRATANSGINVRLRIFCPGSQCRWTGRIRKRHSRQLLLLVEAGVEAGVEAVVEAVVPEVTVANLLVQPGRRAYVSVSGVDWGGAPRLSQSRKRLFRHLLLLHHYETPTFLSGYPTTSLLPSSLSQSKRALRTCQTLKPGLHRYRRMTQMFKHL